MQSLRTSVSCSIFFGVVLVPAVRFPIRFVIMKTQAQKGTDFRKLHEQETAFIIPNPWDIGTARLLAHIGFQALATTSAGYAFSVGKRDGEIGRDEMIKHVAEIAAATDLPVSADLEKDRRAGRIDSAAGGAPRGDSHEGRYRKRARGDL